MQNVSHQDPQTLVRDPEARAGSNRGRLLRWLTAAVFLGAVGTADVAHADPRIRGDYDGDGVQDLAVGLVRSLGGGNFRTEILARGSSGTDKFYTFPAKTDAFINGKYLVGQPTIPALVLVLNNGLLLWSFLLPDGSVRQLTFGTNGAIITNAGDFDGDGVDDIYFVRPGVANEFGDGRTYLHWFIALSGSGGQVVDIVFGESGDRVYTFYENGKLELGATRVSNGQRGACGNGEFAHYRMRNPLDVNNRQVLEVCWGLSGDIFLVPHNIIDQDGDGNVNTGSVEYVIARIRGNVQDAYILRNVNDKNDFEIRTLGLSTSKPMIGNILNEGNTFAWFQPDVGLHGIRQQNGNDTIVSFGISTNLVLRPDGTVLQPSDTGQLGGGGGGGGGGGPASCSSVVTSGFLYKPSSQDSGGTREGFPLILLSRFSASSNCFRVLSENAQIFSCFGEFNSARIYEGFGCGLQNSAECGGRDSASELAAQSLALGGTRGGFILDPGNGRCYRVPDFGRRHDVR